jgi:hypothetical protein
MSVFTRIRDFFLSLRLTVVLLLLLSVQVVIGTLYQVDYGLYAAQKRFFESWVILFFGVIPFPGGAAVLTLLFINLFANMLARFEYGWRQMGLILIHMGLLLLLAGGWVTKQFGQESFMSLIEGEGSNLSLSYHDWEVAAWPADAGLAREVVAIDASYAKPGRVMPYEELGFALTVELFHRNARAFRSTDPAVAATVANAMGITMLEADRANWDPQDDVPGGVFMLQPLGGGESGGEPVRVLLFGGDRLETRVRVGDEDVMLSLRRKRFPLPVMMNLIDFEKSFHPNSDIPRSFSSFVEVDLQGVQRDVLIEMNRPFRYQGYTFYQASYADMDSGQELSTFAVVLNYGRVIPYVATAMTFLGLAVHFLISLFQRRRGAP